MTTAARYADAVPWEFLATARERGTALSIVLNRVPDDAEREVTAHLGEMIREERIDAVLLVVGETRLEEGRLPAVELAPVRRWLDALAADADARGDLIRRTLSGALRSLPARAGAVERAASERLAQRRRTSAPRRISRTPPRARTSRMRFGAARSFEARSSPGGTRWSAPVTSCESCRRDSRRSGID